MANIGPGGRREGPLETRRGQEAHPGGEPQRAVERWEPVGSASLRPVAHERPSKIVAGGSLFEAIAGAGGVVLAVLGLAGLYPVHMAGVATIALGVALVAQGGAAASHWSKLVRDAHGERLDARTELGSGIGGELFGGGSGIVLGVLALLGLLPGVLVPVALMIFGGTLLLASGVTVDLSRMVGGGANERLGQLAREAALAASGTQVLIGLGALVIGIIALVTVGTSVLTLSLVGLLCVGASVLFSGSAITGRMIGALRHGDGAHDHA